MALHSDCFIHRVSHVRIIVNAIVISMLALLLLLETFEWIYMDDHHDMAKFMYKDTWFYGAVSCVLIAAWALAFYLAKKQGKQDYLSMLANAVEYSGEAISITSAQGRIRYVNPMFTELTGYQADEVIGKSAQRLLNSKAQCEKTFYAMLEHVQQGKPWHGKLTNRKKDGSFFPTQTSISPIKNEKGHITHYITIQNDDSFAEQVHEKEIKEAKMASLATAVGGIAHEFNNILTGIMGNAYLVKLKESDGELKEKLDAIETLSEKAAGMVQQMLVYVGHDVKKHTHVTLNLNELVQINVDVFNKERGICCQFQAWHETLLTEGDVAALSNALMQLLENAKDAVKGLDCPEIIVKTELIEKVIDGDDTPSVLRYACIRVTDNGAMIPQEIRESIFEPFFTTKDVGEGTGLGLSAVYGIAKEHHGFVKLDESSDDGCTFLFCLPLSNQTQNYFLGESI